MRPDGGEDEREPTAGAPEASPEEVTDPQGTRAAAGSGDGLGTYEWLQRGLGLLEGGHAAAAATVLERVAADEPGSASVLEALARAQFTAGRPGASVRTFERLAELAPDSDYARFGLGQSLRRLGRLPQAAEQLALAVAMRPQRAEYVEALARVRALLEATSASRPRPGTTQDDGAGSAVAAPDDSPEDSPAGLVVVTRDGAVRLGEDPAADPTPAAGRDPDGPTGPEVDPDAGSRG